VFVALCCIHERGFIHQKLSPENMVIDADGHVKVGGFLTVSEKAICGNPEHVP
jgi:serine/threonine protein kinase